MNKLIAALVAGFLGGVAGALLGVDQIKTLLIEIAVLAPTILIVAPLLAGRYVGHELIVRLAEKGPSRRRRSSVSPAPE